MDQPPVTPPPADEPDPALSPDPSRSTPPIGGVRRRPGRPSDEGLARIRRRRRMAWIIRIVLLLLVLVVGALLYLQSAHALRHLVLPMISRSLGTELQLKQGDWSWGGRVNLEGLLIQGADGQPALSAERLMLHVRPTSLIGGGPPEILELEARSPRVRLAVDRFGRSNWDFTPDQPKPEEERTARSPRPFPEVRLERASIADLGMVYETADGLRVAVTDLDLTAAGMARGATGTYDLKVAAELARPAANLRQALSLSSTGKLIQQQSGEELGWDAALQATVSNLADEKAAFSEVSFDGAGKGQLTSAGKIEQAFELAATTPQGKAGHASGQVSWDPEQDLRRASIKLEQLGREALNPLLAAIAPVQLQGGTLDGDLSLDGTGKLVAFRADMKGKQLLLRRGTQPASPPIDFTASNGGSINLEKSSALLSEIQWQLIEAGRTVLSVALNQPTELAYGGGGSALAQTSARIQLKADRVSVSTLRPLVALAGVSTSLDPFRAGTLTADLALDVERGGEALAIRGDWQGDGLQLEPLGPEPLNVRQGIDGSLDQLNALTLRSSKLQLARGGRELLVADFSGKHDLKAASGQWQIDATLPEAIAAVNGLAGKQVLRVEGLKDGRLVAKATIDLLGAKQQVGVKGSADWAGSSIALQGGTVPLDARANYEVLLDQVAGRLDLKPVKLELTGAKEQGTIEASGAWPLSTTAKDPGELALKVRKVDLGPWLVLLGTLSGQQVPYLPLEADEKLTAGADGRLRLEGEARIGLPAQAGSGGDVMTAEVKHALSILGDQLEDLLVDLSTSGGGANDKLKITGRGMVGAKTSLDLVTQVEMLDADRLMGRMQAITGTSAEPAAASGTTPERSAPPTGAGPRVASSLSIQRAVFRGNELAAAKGTALLENRVLAIKLDEGKLNGGPITADARVEMGRQPMRYAWDFKGQDTPISPLLALSSPGASQKISGKINVTSRGTAEGSGEELKRSLQSDTQFEIKDGEMAQIVLLDALAQQTGVESFRSMKFFEILGGLKADGGKIDFQECLVRGPLHRIDLKGQVDLVANTYKFTMLPAVQEALAAQIPGNKYIPQLIKNAGGLLQFPFGVMVRGENGKYIVTPTIDSPVKLGGVAGAVTGAVTGGVNDGVGTVVEGGRDAVEGVFRGVGGLLDRKSTDKRAQEAPTETAPPTTASEGPVSAGAVSDIPESTDAATTSTEATPEASPETTPTPSPTPRTPQDTVKDAGRAAEQKAKDAVGGVVGGLGGLLKKK